MELSTALGHPVTNQQGEKVYLDQLVQGPTLIVFLRHFGCIACSEFVGDFKAFIDEFQKLGIKIIFVGNGLPQFIPSFLERTDIVDKDVTVVTDPSLSLYEEMGLVRSSFPSLIFYFIKTFIRAFMKGHWQGSIEGDHFQQGGALLINGEGEVEYLYKSQYMGDQPNSSEVYLKALTLFKQNNPEIVAT